MESDLRPDNKSRMSREVHVRFREGLVVRFPRATRLMGITNTAGTVPGIIGVALTGWLVDTTGTYSAAFALAAGVNIFGAIVWLAFASGERIID